jgi:hypothetical protein
MKPDMKLPTETAANVDRLMAYVQKNDRQGAICFADCLRDCTTRADVHDVLHGVLLTRFEVDVKECPTAVNLDDRADAIENLHRYGFGSLAFDACFPEIMAYALHNIHPEDNA